MKTKKYYSFDGLAGCVKRWKNRKGHLVGVYDAVQAGMDTYGWAVVCEGDHAGVVIMYSLRAAFDIATDTTNFCPVCQEKSDSLESLSTPEYYLLEEVQMSYANSAEEIKRILSEEDRKKT